MELLLGQITAIPPVLLPALAVHPQRLFRKARMEDLPVQVEQTAVYQAEEASDSLELGEMQAVLKALHLPVQTAAAGLTVQARVTEQTGEYHPIPLIPQADLYLSVTAPVSQTVILLRIPLP